MLTTKHYFYGKMIIRVLKKRLRKKQKQYEGYKTNEELKNQQDLPPDEVAKYLEHGSRLDATKHAYITESPFLKETLTRANTFSPKIQLEHRQISKVIPINPESSQEVRDELS